jgi:chromosome segregation ATPase
MERLLLYYILDTLIGVSIGIFLSNLFLKKRFKTKLELLNRNIKEKERCLVELENECDSKRDKLDKIVIDSIICKAELLHASNSLRKKSDELYRVQDKLDNIKHRVANIEKIEQKNRQLINELSKLKEKNKELESSSQNSMLLEESERLKKIIQERDKELDTIHKREEEEKLHFFKISKDQFKQIENRLKEYKTKSDKLEKEHVRFITVKNHTDTNTDNILQKTDDSFVKISNISNSSFSKDNSKKISKS